MLDRVSKVWNTVRYMTPRQWKYRLYYTARNRLKKRTPRKLEQPNKPLLLPAYYAPELTSTDTHVAEGVLQNEIPTISRLTVKFEGDWDLKGEEYRLVCFKLNSFRWLIDLSDAYKATRDIKYIEKGFELIKNWWEKCGSIISGDKWNAYVIAERIENWIAFCSEYDAENIDRYAEWIYPQALELKDSIEFQLGANHLLSEAKALVWAGAFLKNDELYRLGKKVLLDEFKTQFLSDGGHYERSVSYHVESLQQYFETYAILMLCGDSDADKFAEVMEEPYRYLNGMIGVNGKIPLFNDAAYDYPLFDAADFLATAEIIYGSFPPGGRKGDYYNRWSWVGRSVEKITWEAKTRYESTGYIHYRFNVADKAYSFFMDVANCGPDENLGHAHGDALSVMLNSEDKEILVDSGVFTYKAGSERNECRATKAHNTVEIDGKNSAEIWSAFRVAQRGHTKVLGYKEDGLWVIATHDGYKKILKDPVEHIREVTLKDGCIEISDTLQSKKAHAAVSRFHIGPDCIARLDGRNRCIIDDHIYIESESDMQLVQCYVAKMFGIKQQTKRIEIDFKGNENLKTTITIR